MIEDVEHLCFELKPPSFSQNEFTPYIEVGLEHTESTSRVPAQIALAELRGNDERTDLVGIVRGPRVIQTLAAGNIRIGDEFGLSRHDVGTKQVRAEAKITLNGNVKRKRGTALNDHIRGPL